MKEIFSGKIPGNSVKWCLSWGYVKTMEKSCLWELEVAIMTGTIFNIASAHSYFVLVFASQHSLLIISVHSRLLFLDGLVWFTWPVPTSALLWPASLPYFVWIPKENDWPNLPWEQSYVFGNLDWWPVIWYHSSS